MEDRRIKRTRRFLTTALLDLLREKPISQITVKELTDRSDVNRATFYRHYQDLYDMLDQMEQALFTSFSNALTTEPPPTDAPSLQRLYFRILSFVAEHADFCVILFGRNSDRSLLRRLESFALNFCGLHSPQDQPPLKRFSATFLVSGFISVVEQWLSDGMQISPQELASFVVCSTREGISLDLFPRSGAAKLQE